MLSVGSQLIPRIALSVVGFVMAGGALAAPGYMHLDASHANDKQTCLRRGDRIVHKTREAVVVYVRERRAFYGCLKSLAQRVRVDRRQRDVAVDVYRPAGRFVVVRSYASIDGSDPTEPPPAGGEIYRVYLTVTDLRTGREYLTYRAKGFSVNFVVVRRTGSVAFVLTRNTNDLRLLACEMPMCYDSVRHGHPRELDRTNRDFDDVRLSGSRLTWTRDGQPRSGTLR